MSDDNRTQKFPHRRSLLCVQFGGVSVMEQPDGTASVLGLFGGASLSTLRNLRDAIDDYLMVVEEAERIHTVLSEDGETKT